VASAAFAAILNERGAIRFLDPGLERLTSGKAFGAKSRLKGGCRQNCLPHKVKCG
jgi:hypothetical protein